MENIIHFDGIDASDLDAQVIAMPGAWDAPDAAWQTAKIPGRDGFLLASDLPEVPGRARNMQFAILADTFVAAETIFQTLKAALWGRLVQYRYDHQTDRAHRGLLGPLKTNLLRNDQGALGWATADTQFLELEPYAVDTALSVVSGVAGQRVSIAMGSGPMPIDLIVSAGASSVVTPTVIVREENGEELFKYVFSSTIAAGDYVRITGFDGGSVTKSVSGVVTSAEDDVTITGDLPEIPATVGTPTAETSGGFITIPSRRRWT